MLHLEYPDKQYINTTNKEILHDRITETILLNFSNQTKLGKESGTV
jgi:hypothetical protein